MPSWQYHEPEMGYWTFTDGVWAAAVHITAIGTFVWSTHGPGGLTIAQSPFDKPLGFEAAQAEAMRRLAIARAELPGPEPGEVSLEP